AVNILGEGGAFFGKAHLIGGSILFNNRGMTGERISISGEPVVLGNRSRMDAGDLLKLEWRLGNRSTQYALLWSSISAEAPVISAYGAVNGHRQRHPEQPEQPLGGELVESLNAALRQRDARGAYLIPEGTGRRQFDLALTLDAGLDARIQHLLEDYARSLREPGEPPFRAAVTVMDAKTGELLALASYPAAADLAGFTGATAARDRLLRNHNLSRLPVGSVAKIMLSAAILEQAPLLAGLRIRGYSTDEFDQILGISIDPTLSDHPYGGGADGLIDFDHFIEHSSNKYAATLLTLATGIDDQGTALLPPAANPAVPDILDPQERFYVGGTFHDRRPALRLPIVADRRTGRVVCAPITTLEHLGHILNLTRLWGVPISRKTLTAESGKPWHRGPGAGDDLVDTSAWLPLLDHLYGHDAIPLDHPFFNVSPERENLAFNLTRDYRAQYLTSILGGGSSTWTNPQLCRIFSSLVTGKRPTANLVRRIRPSQEMPIEPPPATDDLPMSPRTRQLLLDAMTRVAGPEGTAKSINGLLLGLDRQLESRGKVLGFFSKTGSPTDLGFVLPATTRAVDLLIARGALRLGASGLIHYRDSGPVMAELPEAGERSRSLEALEVNAADMGLLRRLRVSPRFIVRTCSTWNRSKPLDRVQFEIRHGKLVRMLKNEAVESTGGVYVFTLAIYDQTARKPGTGPRYLPLIEAVHHQPERALSVAISIEGQGDSPSIAVPFARRLISEVLWQVVREGW
ncbi:MAG: hypothetical protein M3O15_12135, partial [Acidobacteriota bacterium]|nr:hypothetical protein [Acidobacteriota bacterium]